MSPYMCSVCSVSLEDIDEYTQCHIGGVQPIKYFNSEGFIITFFTVFNSCVFTGVVNSHSVTFNMKFKFKLSLRVVGNYEAGCSPFCWASN